MSAMHQIIRDNSKDGISKETLMKKIQMRKELDEMYKTVFANSKLIGVPAYDKKHD